MTSLECIIKMACNKVIYHKLYYIFFQSIWNTMEQKKKFENKKIKLSLQRFDRDIKLHCFISWFL